MLTTRFFIRIAVIAGLLLTVSAGPIAQQEAEAYCFYPKARYTEYYVMIQCDAEGCEPQRSVVGYEYWDCDGNYYSEGNTNCSGLVRCETTFERCDPICE